MKIMQCCEQIESWWFACRTISPVTKSTNIKIAVKNSSVETLINNEEVFSTLSKEVINDCMITPN